MNAREQPVAAEAVYNARPTILVGGRENDRVWSLLSTMEISEAEGGLTRAELRFGNVASLETGGAEIAFRDDAVLGLGRELRVYTGEILAPTEVFRGVISAIEEHHGRNTPPEVVVLAEDKLQRARMTRRTKVHEAPTIKALARDLATSLGLTDRVTGYEVGLGVQMQLDESDLAFLRRMLRRYDGDLQVIGDELHAKPWKDAPGDPVTIELGGQLIEVQVAADLAHQITEATVTGWNVGEGKAFQARSTGRDLGTSRGRTGREVLLETLGARAHHVTHTATRTKAEAEALAQRAFDTRARRFVVARGIAEGNARIRVGGRLRLQGLGDRFDNVYTVIAACHRFDRDRGYETDFEAECAHLGGA